MKIRQVLLVVSLFLLAIIVLVFLRPLNNYHYGKSGNLYINEVVAKNNYTLLDNDLGKSDFIEIYNDNDHSVNLKGYYLSDEEYETKKWQFPDIEIEAKSYLIVYASGKDKCDLKNKICHTNFKLNDGGETVTLLDNDANILTKIKYDFLDDDVSYGYSGDKYVYYYIPTPGSINEGDISEESIIRKSASIPIYINEYMTMNTKSNYDEDGDYSNWVELYNYSDTDINLKGMYLSDRETKLNKFVFGDVTISAKSYLMVYLSGKDKTNNEIHTPFIVNDKDGSIVLASSDGEIIDKVSLVTLKDNISYGKNGDTWNYYTKVTPGKENGVGFTSLEAIINKDKKLLIKEVSANSPEAIEIKNISDEDINLSGYGLGDKNNYIMKFPSITIKKGEYLVVYGSDNYSYQNGKIYAGFHINNSDEKIYLYDCDSYVIDIYETGRLTNNVSSGINIDGKKVLYKSKTFGSNNADTYFSGYASSPSFSIDGGYVESGTKIVLSTIDNSKIYYTTDGSFPTSKSTLYQNEISVNSTMVIKAIAYKDDYIESEIISRTFIVGRKHEVAVVSISTDNDSLFGYYNGMYISGAYNNYRQDWERKISFEFYENDGTFGTSFTGGTKLVGQDSREFPQKSFAIYLRNKYGLDEVTYPFFTDHDVQTFSSFTLRNSGEDVSYLKIKDIFLIEILKGQMDLDFQYYRPVVLYVNGKYWGLYNIREKINESYLANNHGVDEDNVDLIKGIDDVKAGSITNYNNLINYVRTHNVADNNVYEYLKTQIDMQELMNYWVVQTYYRNTDTGNIRFWRSRASDGKWRWVLFDLDWAMFPTTYYSGYNDLTYPFQPYGHGTGMGFPTTLTYNLWKNSEFRDQYLKTLAYHLKNTFNPERCIKLLDGIVDQVKSEMPYQISRWYDEFKQAGVSPISSMTQWNARVAEMKVMLRNRYSMVLNSIRSQFGLSDAEYNKYFGDL